MGAVSSRRTLLSVVALLIVFMLPVDALRSEQPIVVLDPGHGGRERGASASGVIERDSNGEIAHRVRDLLREHGVAVVITREVAPRAEIDAAQPSEEAATFLDLQARVAAANATHAALFVSIHSNAISDPDLRGVEGYYNADRPFAEANRRLTEILVARVAERVADVRGEPPRSAVFRDTDIADAAGRLTPFFVLGPEREVTREELVERGIPPGAVGLGSGQDGLRTAATQMPGALVELLYVSNAEDAALLQDPQVREAMARGIADGIREFLR